MAPRQAGSNYPTSGALLCCSGDPSVNHPTVGPNGNGPGLYAPLGRDQIRLLSLAPGRLTDQPRCHLLTVSLDTRPKFAALSYEWGDSADPSEILLCDRPCRVRRNLWLALCYLQASCHPPISRSVWVDAICINQADYAEKEWQVGRMMDIFRRAERTYMWLGAPSHDSSLGMRTIEKQSMGWGDVDVAASAALSNLLARPYWSRVWVVQEALCSSRAIVKCGFVEVALKLFAKAERFLEQAAWTDHTARASDETRKMFLPFRHCPFFTIFKWNFDLRQQPQEDLLFWLQATSNFSSTLPRDRIYAILGLTRKSVRDAIEINYSWARPNRRLFSQVTSCLLLHQQSANALQVLDLRQLGRRLPLPSWVPDWRARQPDLPVRPQVSDQAFCAGQDGAAWARLRGSRPPLGTDIHRRTVEFAVSSDMEVLKLRALCTDRIAYAHTALPEGDLPLADRSFVDALTSLRGAFFDACRTWKIQAFCRPSNPYSAAIGLADLMLLTLTFDAVEDRSDAGFRCSDAAQWRRAAPGCTEALPGTMYWRPEDLHHSVVERCVLRSLIVTEKGYLGVAPCRTQPGDLVCISPNARHPIILRDEGDHCHWVGGAYVYGLMFGHALEIGVPTDVRIFEVR